MGKAQSKTAALEAPSAMAAAQDTAEEDPSEHPSGIIAEAGEERKHAEQRRLPPPEEAK